MTNSEFKKVGRLLKELYKELEAEALKNGVDIFGEEYKEAQAKVRLALLTKMGFSLEEYIEAKDKTANEQRAERGQERQELLSRIEELEERVVQLETRA